MTTRTIRLGLIALCLFIAPVASALNGPGLGNLTYGSNELFERISLVDGDLGIPDNSNDPAAVFGLNLGYMYNGYFVGIFAPDHGHSSGGWLVLDVSDPRNPTLVSRAYDSVYSHGNAYNGYANGEQDPHWIGETGDFRENHGTGFSIQGGRFYAAIPTGYGIEIWDFTNVGPGVAPQKVTAFDIPDIAAGDYTNTSWQLVWQAPYIYVANANQGITVIDASDVQNPTIVSRTPISLLGGFRIGPIFALGNHMIVSSMDTNGRVASIDISDPASPRLLTTYQPGQRFYATCFNGTEVMFTNRGSPAYMQVVDISDPGRFVELSKNELQLDEALYCATQGDAYFSGNQESVTKVDISDPANPVYIGDGALNVGSGSDHGQVSVFGNLVYVGNDHGGGNGFIVHQTAPDQAPPQVNAVSPRDQSEGQQLTTRVGLAFDDSVLVSSLDSSTFIVREQGSSQALAGTYSGQAGIVNFTPDTPLLPNTTYEVVVPANGITDWSGNATAVQFLSTFTTGDGSGSSNCTENCPIGGGSASANSSEAGHPAGDGNDGDYETRWTASDGSVPQWYQVDYGSLQEFSGARMTFEFEGEKYDYIIEVSNDGTNWTPVTDRSNNSTLSIQQTVTFSPVTARYMRIRFVGLPAGVWAALYEFTALQPVPGCNATGDEACFVRLIADSEVNGEPWASAAEINLYDSQQDTLLQTAITVHDVSSEELIGENGSALNAIDGDAGTYWHTEWQSSEPVHPHVLTLKLDDGTVLGGLRYLPRQGNENGRIAAYRIEVSRNGSVWSQVASGTLANSTAEQDIGFTGGVGSLEVTLGDPVPVEVGEAVNVTALASGGSGGIEYSFDFGDGSAPTAFSSSNSASHTYGSAGHFPVIVTVRDGDGLSLTDSRVQTVHRPLSTVAPTRSSSIQYAGGAVYTVNSDNDTVSRLDAQTLQKSWEMPVGNHPTTLAVADNGDIWVVNSDQATLSVLDGASGAELNAIDMPRGSAPFGIAFSPGSQRLYVTLQATGRLLTLDTATGSIIGDLDVGPDPRGIAVQSDGSAVYVTRFISARDHAEVRRVNAAGLAVEAVITLQNDTTTVDGENMSQGLPNYLTSVTLSPDGGRAWVPSQKVNTSRGSYLSGQPLTFESAVRTIVSQIDLATGTEDFGAQFDFNDANLATDAAFTPLGDYVFVALQANNQVEILDAYSGASLGALNTGLAPKGVAFNEDGTRLYVHNFMDRSVEMFDTSTIIEGGDFVAPSMAVTNTVATEALSATILRGKQIFYNAADNRMVLDGYLTCASCHLDGDSDGRVWDFTDRGEGLRNTRRLKGEGGTRDGNVHWTANFDEIQDFENDIRNHFGGLGFLSDSDFNATADPLGAGKTGLNSDLDALSAYVSSLDQTAASPFRNADGSLTAAALAGEQLFDSLGCAGCHSGPTFTDGQRHDVGTLQADSGQGSGEPLQGVGFDTPSLLGLWFKAPYLHNGQAATLQAVLNSTVHGNTASLSQQERDQLEQFLLQIEGFAPVSRLQSRQSGQCIDVDSAELVDGADILQWNCHNDANQRWLFERMSAGYVVLAAEHSGKCMDVADQGLDAGANVAQWTCNGGTNQQWLPVLADSGYFALKARHSGLCLGLDGQGSLEQQACSGADSQLWRQH